MPGKKKKKKENVTNNFEFVLLQRNVINFFSSSKGHM